MTKQERDYLEYSLDQVSPGKKDNYWYMLLGALMDEHPKMDIKKAIDYANRLHKAILVTKVL